MTPTAIDPSLITRMLQHWGRHFVSLIFRYQEVINGVPSHLQTLDPHSGFVVELGGEWYLIVAGHALDRISKLQDEGKITNIHACLGDVFGERVQSRTPIPFYYDASNAFGDDADELGLDFGAIHLRRFYRQSLEANGVEAIPFSHWEHGTTKFLGYALYGLPASRIPQQIDLRVTTEGQLSVNETMPFLEPISAAEVPEPRRNEPWFFARVYHPEQLPDIKGMSGGPIFGFYLDQDRKLRYKLVAVQSGWFPTLRIIYACTLARLTEALLNLPKPQPSDPESVTT